MQIQASAQCFEIGLVRTIEDFKMSGEDELTDYYKVLECDRTASAEDIKRNYQRLVLTTHPDKIQIETNRFHLVQKAWSVLKDSESRKQYDAELSCKEHSDLLLYETVNLSDMEWDDEHNMYTYNCRCGGVYTVEKCDHRTPFLIIGCDECSFSIQVNL